MSSTNRESVEAATAGIGRQLAAVRQDRRIRVSELARLIGVSSSLISQIERGQSRPSVETLFSLAQVLDVPVDTFFAADQGSPEGGSAVPKSIAEPPALPPLAGPGDSAVVAFPSPPSFGPPSASRSEKPRAPYVVRRHERASIDIRGGVRWERLTPTALDGVEFLELVYAPGAESDRQLYRHPGIELVLVTHGVMTIFVGFERHDLPVGDSIAFPSSTPHRYVNLTDQETRATTVILRDDLSSLTRGTTAATGAADVNPSEDPADPSG
jgi:transcriptional regulator with XRE-family HTH domain